MTAQQKILSAPVLPDASNGVLYVHHLKDPVKGLVNQYENAAVGDRIVLTVTTSTNNQWRGSFVLTASSLGQPVVFDIPKDTFEKNLEPGATAESYYEVTRATQLPEHSPKLELRLEL